MGSLLHWALQREESEFQDMLIEVSKLKSKEKKKEKKRKTEKKEDRNRTSRTRHGARTEDVIHDNTNARRRKEE